MKRKKRKQVPVRDLQRALVRGFVATALLAAVEGRRRGVQGVPRDALGRGLKGALAVATGTMAAAGLQERRVGQAAVAVLAGAVLLTATEHYFTPEHTEGAL